MRTNVEIDDDLIETAMRASGARTKKQVVDLALRALIRESKKRSLFDLVGKVNFYEGYDYKKLRKGRYDPD